MKIQRQWEQFGQFELGDLVATIPSASPMWTCSEYDRVTFTDSSEPFNYVAIGGVDLLPWAAYEIDTVVWRDQVTKALVFGGLPTQAADNTLSWTAGSPPNGVQFTISGRRRPQFWVFSDLIQDRAHSAGLALPRRVVLRKYELAGR